MSAQLMSDCFAFLQDEVALCQSGSHPLTKPYKRGRFFLSLVITDP